MSIVSLRTQIKEDHLTCAICSDGFTNPKALPCIHTFCELCLRDYVVSRGHESTSHFPCPLCRRECKMPPDGVEGFPNNHLMSSLSQTVDSNRPVPRPRRSLGQGLGGGEVATMGNQQITETEGASYNKTCQYHSQDLATVCSTHDPKLAKLCSNDDDPNKMLNPSNHRVVDPSPPNYHSTPSTTTAPLLPGEHANDSSQSIPIGWNLQNLPPAFDVHSDTARPRPNNGNSPGLYPSVPPHYLSQENTACSENLILQFGKQGSMARDFKKPSGLAVSRDGQYVVLDKDEDESRLLVFNSAGEITTAFKCGSKVKGIAITQNDDIIASVDKRALRVFTLKGQPKGDFGNFSTFEKPGRIAELKNRGVVITSVEGNCVFVLTDQMKLATKFGRRGNGDGYFFYPSFVTVNSKSHIIITDKVNGNVQVFNSEGKFKLRFASNGQNAGQLNEPLGVCVDKTDNIIIADSGNFRVEVFSSSGMRLCSMIKDTHQLGENVRPVSVAVTPTGKVAVLLCGPYFAEVRIYTLTLPSRVNPVSFLPSSLWSSSG